MQISTEKALHSLKESGELFIELFSHGTLSLEIYKPDKADYQEAHDRDEVYVIISGEGEFFHNGSITSFKQGDFVFVKAGIDHRFVNFSKDFSSWVLFYGPEGGEKTE